MKTRRTGGPSAALRHCVLALACGAACNAAAAAAIDPRLVAAAQSGGVDVLLVLPRATTSLAPMATDADYRLRRRALVSVLQAHADATQASVGAWLDERRIPHRRYWISNVVAVRADAATLQALALRDDILRIESDAATSAHLPRPDAGVTPASVDAIEWGVAKIGAPAVWAAGYTGRGIVIAGEDTGYMWDHPALQPHYRGWDGSTADHDYNWHDAIHDAAPGNPCGSDSPFPCDDYGHGTHTAGTFVGDDGGTHQIGVAPGAQWVGCRNMDDGNGTPARYIECMQWMLAPTDLAGANPNPDLAPDVVSNSWTCTVGEGCTAGDELADAVNNVVAGGIVFVVAAGNGGTACGSILAPPAIYDASIVVGATDSNDALAGFSLRGPVAGSGLVRPDISGPGVSIVSSWNDGGYQSDSGTSMATPHVAGTVALMMSVDASLKGQPAAVVRILRLAAERYGVTDPVTQTCGGTPATTWPNNMIGYGRVDAYEAAQLTQAYGGAADVFTDGFDGLLPAAAAGR